MLLALASDTLPLLTAITQLRPLLLQQLNLSTQFSNNFALLRVNISITIDGLLLLISLDCSFAHCRVGNLTDSSSVDSTLFLRTVGSSCVSLSSSTSTAT